MSQCDTAELPQQSGTQLIELYWALMANADEKFHNIRDLPYYQRTKYDTHFCKVFKIYAQLWKFQKENRTTLVETGLRRWEIGHMASRIGQLYFGMYMRTSDAHYLSEAYIFYEAILTREYFKDDSLARKQLKFFARFLIVSLVLNRRDMVYQLADQLTKFLDECKRNFQETDFKVWNQVIQEIVKFLKADTDFMNLRPLRYSVVLDLHLDSLPLVTDVKRKLMLRDALLCSYHSNEVKFALTIDTFRMLQSLEWEPRGSFYKANLAPSIVPGSNVSHNGASGPSRLHQDINHITDLSLPPNPRKAILFCPSVTHFMADLGTVCEELPSDGILLIYLSASGNSSHVITSPNRAGSSIGYTENIARDYPGYTVDWLQIRPHGPGGGMNCIYPSPSDILPFTRRPLFLIVDSDNSKAFKAISGAEKGEPAAILLSPVTSPTVESSLQSNGSLFSSFLTTPLQTFALLVGFTGSNAEYV
ncbi:protein SCAI isoform X1 [Salvia divinorum]|uniref:Protein SCAI isoform X1 n=1 Tax=Salvia divinorum TaxID=28513 RepID=A0ABD1GAH9_SALDI